MADKKNIYSAIFGEDPATQQAAAQRDSAFQSWLNTRKQAAEQQRTSDVNMAKYNALGNILTTMVQPIGWAVGGKGKTTGNYQPYDNRQYLEAFNRAVKASDDLRNIGSAEQEYQFKLADENYRRQLALEDAARNREQAREDQERAWAFQLEKQQNQFQQQREMEEMRQDARRALEEYKATHRVTRTGTGGLSVDDRILLKMMDGYNKYVNDQTNLKRPYDTFEKWMADRGYTVQTGRFGGSSSTPTPPPTAPTFTPPTK